MKIERLVLSLRSVVSLATGLMCLGTVGAIAEPYNEVPSKPYADTRARMKDQKDIQVYASGTLLKATQIYNEMVKGAHGQVPDSILAKAQCVTVLPDVVTGAMVVGGTHGVGVASCRENEKWSVPAFVELSAVSFGAQIGGKSSDIVLFVIDEKAKAALKKGRFALGADASIVAGNFDQNFEVSSHGAIAYTRTDGVFAGASISGGLLSSDDMTTEAFYGKDINYVSLLEGRTTTKQNDQSDRFVALLPR